MTKMFLKKKTLLNGKLCKVKLILMLQFNYMALQRYLLEQHRWDVVNAKGNLLFMPSRFEHKFKIWRAP
uniref:ATATH11; ATPase, coupled to transmembrane movement of substances / transporter n=1 Tax=Solanum tuberosum TaxID=4113 RepID=M1C980_SOLTU